MDVLIDEYSYDLSIPFLAISFPDEWIFRHLSNLVQYDQFQHAMMQNVYAEIINGQLETSQKFTFYYSLKTTTAHTEKADKKIIVFPNPSTDFVEFEIDNISRSTMVELYDMQGLKVISKLLPPNNQISLSHLKTGIYVCKLIQGNEVTQGKIIKK